MGNGLYYLKNELQQVGGTALTGLIILNKHEGVTSFMAAALVRRLTGEKRVGHTGTLDPMATGVLPVMLGGATKFCELLPSHDKAYRATLLLGITTDTLDITGTVQTQREVCVTAAEFDAALARFTGEIEQLPPMYSAVSKNGVRLYKLARQGIEVERETRRVTVYSSETVSVDEIKGEYIIDVRCSAGTYIRTLISDVGEALGCGAVMTGLCRTEANGFTLEDAHTVPALEALARDSRLSEAFIPVDKALTDYPVLEITANQAVRFKNGGALDAVRLSRTLAHGFVRVYAPDGAFLGLGEKKEDDGELAVKRLLVTT